MKKRNFLIRAAQILMIAVFLIVTARGVSSLVTSWYDSDMLEKLKELEANIKQATDTAERDSKYLHYIDSEIVSLAALCMNINPEAPESREELEELCGVLDVEKIYITDAHGNLLNSSDADNTGVDFTDPGFESLFQVSEAEPVSGFLYEYDNPGLIADSAPAGSSSSSLSGPNDKNTGSSKSRSDIVSPESPVADETEQVSEAEEIARTMLTYFISGYLSPDRIIIIKNNSLEHSNKIGLTTDVLSLLSRSKYGKNGFFFAVNKDKSIWFYPDPNRSPKTISDMDLPNAIMKDGYTRTFKLFGRRYYCRTRSIRNGELLLICSLPLIEIRGTMLFIILLPCIVVLVSIMLMMIYTRLLVAENAAVKDRHEKSRIFRHKLTMLTITCLVFTLVSGVFSNVLYLYSQQFRADAENTAALADTLDNLKEKQDSGFMMYDKYMSVLTKAASYVIAHNEEYRTPSKLAELRDVLSAKHVLLYDRAGTVVSSDQNYSGLTLSDDPSDLSNQFLWVLRGDPLLIQKTPDPDYLGSPYLFSGAPVVLHGEIYDGLVQLAMNPTIYDRLIESNSMQAILESFDNGENAAALAVEKETGKVYASDPEFMGLTTSAIGFKEAQLTDGFIGFLRLLNHDVIGCCKSNDEYTVFIVTNPSDLPMQGFRYGFMCVLPGLIVEGLFFLLLAVYGISFSFLSEKDWLLFTRTGKDDASASEEKLLGLLHRVMTLIFVLVVVAEIFRKSLFATGSLGYYIFINTWSKGLHIFSITRCMILSSCAIVVIEAMVSLLSSVCSLLPQKQETFTRMFLSLLKYIGFLGTFFYCATLLGMPTTSLLASAGVLTLMLSMGAQTLVADILSGIFILFEGTFHVGDMITVDNWHGQVVEIGIRNTKIRDLINSDVKIMNNSSIKNVVNYSVYPTFAPITIGIDYDCDLREIEAVIEREKPVMKQNLPLAIGDIMYLGVDSFDDSAVILKFQAACRNQDYLKVKRALNREVKLMFDRNGISVPFPQVVLSKRDDGSAD